MARDPVKDARWIEIISRLDSAYVSDGKKALEKMSGIEVLALRNEKIHELKDVLKCLDDQPHDKAALASKENLVRDANDLADYLNGKIQGTPSKDRGMDR